MSKLKKVNPQKRPATQKQVSEAFDKGIEVGVDFCRVIFTLVLAEEHEQLTL